MSHTKLRNTLASLTCLFAGLFSGFSTSRGIAADSAVGRGVGFAYDSAKEITVVGTVNQVVARPAVGGPVGMHLLISIPGTQIDAHLGPYISSENRQALKPGQLVQIVGVNENVHGKNLLLARQLIFNGRSVTVRNERGFLVHNTDSSRKTRQQSQ